MRAKYFIYLFRCRCGRRIRWWAGAETKTASLRGETQKSFLHSWLMVNNEQSELEFIYNLYTWLNFLIRRAVSNKYVFFSFSIYNFFPSINNFLLFDFDFKLIWAVFGMFLLPCDSCSSVSMSQASTRRERLLDKLIVTNFFA